MEIISWNTICYLFIFGAGGALTKEILEDNKLSMPRISDGEFYLGFIGSLLVGGFVGYFVDHDPITAFFSGYAGFSAIGSLLPKSISNVAPFTPLAIPLNEEKKTEEKFKISLPFLNNFGISQYFGENPEWYKPNGFAGHFGIDFLTPNGTPILACDNGKITQTAFSNGNGYYIEIKHDWGISLYCHLKEKSICAVGQIIKRKEQIGFSGNTGSVRPLPTKENPMGGSHLHFSIKINGTLNPDFKNYIDPLPFFENVI